MGSFFDEEDEPLEIVTSKYLMMSETELRSLCSQYKISIYYGNKKNDIIFKVIPEALNREGFLENFYNNLEKQQREILKFIVNYSGNSIFHAIRKRFNFDITQMRKNGRDVYVWWLELFIDNGEMDEDIKEYYFEFLHDEKLKKRINDKKEYKSKQQKLKKEKEKIEPYLDDITNVEIYKYDFEYDLSPYELFEQEYTNMVENIRIFYQLCKDKKVVITQKRALAVRSVKLLDAQLTIDTEIYVWLLNILSDLKFLTIKKDVIPTKLFDNIINLDDGDLLKAIVEKFIKLDYQVELSYAPFNTTPRGGNGSIQNLRKKIIDIIKKADRSKWISIDSIVNEIPIDSKTLKYIQNGGKYTYGFYVTNGYHRQIKYERLSDLKVVLRYFVKAFIGLFCRFGVCSIGYTSIAAYVEKDLDILYETGERDRPFANIEYFKLKEIGLYSLDIAQSFTSKNDFKLILNPYTLELKVENASKLSELFLENLALKIDETKYKIDISTFMQNINSYSDYERTYTLFLGKCGEELPANWKEFFKLLDSRINSAKIAHKDTVLIKLQNNKDLLQFISTNSKLQSKIIKADGLHIVVLKENLLFVKKILKEYGILI